MKPEIEVRFLNIDHKKLRQQLQAAGAHCMQPMHRIRQAVMDYPDRRLQTGNKEYWSWVRVRDEDGCIVVTYKHITKDASQATHEIEFTATSYEQAIALFKAIGLVTHSEQEKRRETWQLMDSEVMLDEWPWLPPMVEIEGPNEASLQKVAIALGLDWKNAVRGPAADAYMKVYPGIKADESIGQIPKLSFNEMPEWLKKRQKT